MNWLVRLFLQNELKLTYEAIGIGATTLGLIGLFSQSPVAATIKGGLSRAIECNLVAAIYIITQTKRAPINRSELLRRLNAEEISSGDILGSHAWLLLGYCIVLFWAGWLMFGILLIAF